MLSGLHQLKLLRGTPPAEIQLRKRIGRGGVSDLWIASHEAVAHPFIVKYSRHPATQNPYILGQFEREYEASCALSAHGLEHLTTCVFDFDVDIYEHPYIFEEYFPSKSIDILMHVTREWHVVQDILAKTAKILSEVHGAGIVHRDIKPGNILVNAKGEVRIIDFALSTIDGHWHQYHEEGMALGTPLYMSPEQAFGQKIMLTSACDWYSFGVMIYEWLTGNMPFKGATAKETMQMHCYEPAPMPVNTRIYGAPQALPEICQALLCKEPNARFSAVKRLKTLLTQS